MDQERSERRLAAIMFTDIVGYTALMARDEEAARRARDRHEAVVRPLVERHHGHFVEATGDESLSSFPSALDAVSCALAIHRDLADDPELRLRIGIHQGDVTFEGNRVSGDGVNTAARIRPLAEPGGICVSDDVQHSLRGRADLEFASIGERELKNVGRPVAVFAVGRPGTVSSVRAPARPLPGRTWGRLALASIAIALAALVGWWAWSQRAAGPIRSIAVLPLANLSGDAEQEYFADGMTEALIGDLARIGSLRVISRTSAMRYKGSDLALPDIADELGVDAIVEGTVARSGDRVRITAQLIEARSDTHLWAERYERDLEDVLVLQGEVATAIAREIRAELTRDERARLEAAPPVDPKVHDLYLRGRYLWNHRSVESLAQSIRYFERVVEADPTHARGWAGLGDARFIFVFYAGIGPKGPLRAGAREATRRAIELDDSLAEAHAGLGLQLATVDWKFDEAEREFRRAIELDPGYASSYMWYSELLLSVGRTDEAIAAAETARDLDPFAPPVLSDLGSVYLNAGRPEEAAAVLRAALDLDPDYGLSRAVLGMVYLTSGQTEAATRELERADEGSAIASYSLLLARAYARAGETGRARELLRGAEGAQYASPYHLAGALWELGDTDAALEALERAFDTRDPLMIVLKVPLPSTMSEAPQVAALYRDHGMQPPAAIR